MALIEIGNRELSEALDKTLEVMGPSTRQALECHLTKAYGVGSLLELDLLQLEEGMRQILGMPHPLSSAGCTPRSGNQQTSPDAFSFIAAGSGEQLQNDEHGYACMTIANPSAAPDPSICFCVFFLACLGATAVWKTKLQ